MAFDILGPTTRVLAVGLDAVQMRQEVAANNIANVDTPDFRAKTVEWESSLRSAMRAGEFNEDKGPDAALPDLGVTAMPTIVPGGTNGNNVDLRHEVMVAMQSQYQYQTLTRAVSDQANILRASIGA